MTSILTRAAAGRKLTYAEMDSNLTNLNSGKAEVSATDALAIQVGQATTVANAVALAVSQIQTNYAKKVDLAASGGTSLIGYGARSLTDKLGESVSVKDSPYNAKGDSVTDDTAAVQAAIDSMLMTGGVVHFPRGRYKLLGTLSLYPNVTLRGDGSDLSVLDYSGQTSGNWINVHGSLGSSVNIASAMDQYATTCTTVSATGAAVDDDFVLTSQRNALSSDAGDFQLGLPTGSINASYFAEVMTVSQVVGPAAFNFVPALVFPGYRPDNTLETNAYARPSATVQKASWVKGVHISGLTFIAGANSNNSIDFRYAKECSVHGCKFEMGAYAGTAVAFIYSYRCNAYRCIGNHTAQDGAVNVNFAFTTYKTVSAWHCGFVECHDLNGSQCFDTSYNGGANPSMYSYVINCRVINARYNSGTNHSGNYAEHFLGNQFIGCKNGLSIRSRATVAKGNILTGDYTGYGMSISDGWCQDSIIEGNYIENFNEAFDYNDWSSVGNGKISSRVKIINNTCRRIYYGVYMKHQGWATAEYNNTVIRGNTFYALDSYMVRINGYLNGLTISDNEVYGPSTTLGTTSYGVYCDENSVDHTIENNKYVDMGATFYPIRFPNLTDTTTFPTATYPHHGIERRNNRVLGTVNPGYTSTYELTSIASRIRTWTPGAGTVFHAERTGDARVSLVTSDTGTASYYFGNSTDQTNAGISWNGSNGLLTFRIGGAFKVAVSSAYLRPYDDNSISCGNSSNRWSVMYSATSAINTSDANSKTAPQPITDAALRAVRRIKLQQFKFLDAVAEKGEDGARWHFGAIAQEVRDAFAAEGLDAEKFGLFCYDKWDEQPELKDSEGNVVQEYRPAGERYGLRYDELFALKLAALEASVS